MSAWERKETESLVKAFDSNDGKLPSLTLRLSPGTATADEIADILEAFSKLYRLAGGRGIEWKVEAECTTKSE